MRPLEPASPDQKASPVQKRLIADIRSGKTAITADNYGALKAALNTTDRELGWGANTRQRRALHAVIASASTITPIQKLKLHVLSMMHSKSEAARAAASPQWRNLLHKAQTSVLVQGPRGLELMSDEKFSKRREALEDYGQAALLPLVRVFRAFMNKRPDEIAIPEELSDLSKYDPEQTYFKSNTVQFNLSDDVWRDFFDPEAFNKKLPNVRFDFFKTVLLSDHALENIKFLKQQGVDLTISKPKHSLDALIGLGFDQTILDWAMLQPTLGFMPPTKTVEPNVRQSLFASGLPFHAYEVCQYFFYQAGMQMIREDKLKNLLSESLAFFDVKAFYEKEPNDQFIFLSNVVRYGNALKDLKCLSQKGLDFSKIAYDGSIQDLPLHLQFQLEKDNIKIGFLDSLMMGHRISLNDKLDLFGCVLGKEKEGAPNFSTEERKCLLRQGDCLVSQLPDTGAVEKITIDGAKKLLKLYVELSKDLLEIKHAMPSQASPRVSQPYRKALSLTLWLKAYLEKHGESKDIADILGDQASFLDSAQSKFTGDQFIRGTETEKPIQRFALLDSVVEGDQYSIHQLALDYGDHGQCAAASMVMAGLMKKYSDQSVEDMEKKFRKKFNKMKAGGGILLRLSRLQKEFVPHRGTPLEKPITDGDIYEVRTDTKDASVRHVMLAGKRDDHYFFWDVNASAAENKKNSMFESQEKMIKAFNSYSEYIYGFSPDYFTLIDEAMLERITELKHDERLRHERLRPAGTKGGPPAAGSSVSGSGPSSPAAGPPAAGSGPSSPAAGSGPSSPGSGGGGA